MEETRRSSRPFWAGLILTTVLVGLVALPSAAAHLECRVSDTTPSPGQTIGVAGRGFQPGTTVEIYFAQGGNQTLIGTAVVNQQERWSTQVTIPQSADPGSAQIVNRGFDAHSGNPAGCSILIRVTP